MTAVERSPVHQGGGGLRPRCRNEPCSPRRAAYADLDSSDSRNKADTVQVSPGCNNAQWRACEPDPR